MATVKILAIGGGGGGVGAFNAYGRAGGGAGGYQYNDTFIVTPQPYTVTSGTGGSGSSGGSNGTSGTDSIFSTITATGGGGGSWSSNGQGGGSGGGAGIDGINPYTGGVGSFGFNGGSTISTSVTGGAGGGASEAGAAGGLSNGSKGGDGISNSISGASVTYAGGGGSGCNTDGGTQGSGGSGGGGAGSTSSGGNGTNGTNGLGGGGGGASGFGTGGTGGSGVVIISYKTDGSDGVSNASTGGTITTSGSYTIHTFTTSGTFTAVISILNFSVFDSVTISEDLLIVRHTDNTSSLLKEDGGFILQENGGYIMLEDPNFDQIIVSENVVLSIPLPIGIVYDQVTITDIFYGDVTFYTVQDIITVSESLTIFIPSVLNPTNAYTSNNTYAQLTGAISGELGFSVSQDAGVTYTYVLFQTFTAVEAYQTYGSGSTETWGITLTGAGINDTNFRIKMSHNNGFQVISQVYSTFGFAIGASNILTGLEIRAEAYYSSGDSSIYIDNIQAKAYYGTSILPIQEGSQAYASDGRKNGEGAGNGTGVLVYYDSSGNWIATDTGTTVSA